MARRQMSTAVLATMLLAGTTSVAAESALDTLFGGGKPIIDVRVRSISTLSITWARRTISIPSAAARRRVIPRSPIRTWRR
jgi:hypothetical protein